MLCNSVREPKETGWKVETCGWWSVHFQGVEVQSWTWCTVVLILWECFSSALLDMLNWGKRVRNKRSGSGRCQAWRSVSAPPMVALLELALLLLSNSMLECAETDKFFGSKMTRWHQRQSRVRWWRSCLYRERCEWILNLEQVDVQAAEAYFFSKDQLRIELKENGQLFGLLYLLFLCDSGACKNSAHRKT